MLPLISSLENGPVENLIVAQGPSASAQSLMLPLISSLENGPVENLIVSQGPSASVPHALSYFWQIVAENKVQ